MSWNVIIARLCWIIGCIILLGIILGWWGCTSITNIKATITDPNNQVYVYEGPKDIDMTIEREKAKVMYSGKKEGFWEGLLKYLLMKPDIEIRRD
jgi:hypothetical protein